MNICTSLEQSRKLEEILPKESSDMSYDWFVIGEKYSSIPQCRKYIDDELPCWSLAALLAQMPCVEITSSDDGYYRVFLDSKFSNWHNNLVDACVEIITRKEKEQ